MTRVRAFRCDLSKPLITRPIGGIMMEGDALADELKIDVYSGAQAADLTGCAASGAMVRRDGSQVPLDGALAGNIVSVIFDERCYAVSGSFTAFVRLTKGGERVTILRVTGHVETAGDGPIIT